MVFTTHFPRTVRHASVTPDGRWLRHMLDDTAAVQQRDASSTAPAVTVTQDETSMTLQLDVPGVSREQLEIGIEGKVLRIESVEGAGRTYKLAYRLAQEIAADTSSAKLENGVLTVTLSKPAPVDRTTRIAVH